MKKEDDIKDVLIPPLMIGLGIVVTASAWRARRWFDVGAGAGLVAMGLVIGALRIAIYFAKRRRR
jgi:hypothetical protein